MGIEESTSGIVWVGVGFGEFVVDAMITCPVEDGTLIGDGVTEHQENSEREGC